MLANLLVIFFAVKLFKKTIDDQYNRSKYSYDIKYIRLNDLLFSFVMNICLIFCCILSLLSNISEMIFFTLGLTISILLLKLGQYRKQIGSRIMYCLYIAYLLIPIQSIQMDLHEPMIYLSLIGSLVVLIPEPLRDIRIGICVLYGQENSIFWRLVTDVINFVDYNINLLFKCIFTPVFCFIYVRSVSHFYASVLVFIMNMVSGIMVLVNELCKTKTSELI